MKKETTKDADLILFGPHRKPAVWFTYFNLKNKRIRYIVRAGMCGTGRVLAESRCSWGAVAQTQAYAQIEKKLNGYRFVSDLKNEA